MVIDIIALLISGLALYVAWRTNRRVPELIERQISRLEREEREEKTSLLVVALVDTSSWAGKGARKQIEIENRGKAEARNVSLHFPDNDSPVPGNEAERKLPIPVIPPGGSVSLLAATSSSNAPPFNVVLKWSDPSGDREQKATLA